MSNDIWIYMAVLFIYIGRMSFHAPILDIADPLFAREHNGPVYE